MKNKFKINPCDIFPRTTIGIFPFFRVSLNAIRRKKKYSVFSLNVLRFPYNSSGRL